MLSVVLPVGSDASEVVVAEVELLEELLLLLLLLEALLELDATLDEEVVVYEGRDGKNRYQV